MTSLGLVIVVFANGLLFASGQYGPPSPCPNIFHYDSDGQQIFGVIKLAPEFITGQTSIRANFTVRDLWNSGYLGQLKALGSEAQAVKNYRDRFPVQFQVLFPLNTPVPRLTSITVRGRVVCTGPPDVGTSGERVQPLSLDYTFYPYTQIYNPQGSNFNGISNHITPNAPSPVPLAVDQPQCGDRGHVPLVFGGVEAAVGDWPWLVAMYHTHFDVPKFSCSGSLVSNLHVISAAHCMFQKKVVGIHDIVLKLGVYNLNNPSDESVVTRSIAAAHAHHEYSFRNLKNDILVLTMDRPVTFTLQIIPVCLWMGNTEQSNIIGRNGSVIGWGRSEGGSGGTGTPRIAWLPVVSTDTCRARHISFHKLTSNTTFCAGSQNGVGPCNGDSGAGFYIEENNRWYLRGVVSASLPRAGDNSCNLDEYFVFTDAAQYLSWINRIMTSRTPEIQPPNEISTVVEPLSTSGNVQCGTVENGAYTPLVYRGSDVSEGEWPWLVALLREDAGSTQFVCAGTLVSNRHVISGVACVYKKNQLEIEGVVVQLGILELPGTAPLTLTLSAAYVHPNYTLPNTNDIVLMTLKQTVTFTNRIRPACLWAGDANQDDLTGRTGAVVGWGSSETGPGGKGTPKLSWIPIVSTSTCRASRVEFYQLTSESTFCAGNRDGSGPCHGDIGAGLFLKENNRWYMRGLVSASLVNRRYRTCDLQEYVVITDVARYMPWLTEHMTIV